MYIEILGTSFVNKGAELMLHAVLQKIRQKYPEAGIVMAPLNSPYEKRAQIGAYQKIWFSKFGIPVGMHIGKYIHRTLREYYGLVAHEEIDIVLDASGFAYSEQFGERRTAMMAAAFRKWKKAGTKIIMLPQAMGPFISSGIRKNFIRMVDNADLVFPRDDVSFRHVTELAGKRDYIIQSPDFTNLLQGVVSEHLKQFEGRFCIIPNDRMMEKTSVHEKEKYIPFLLSCVRVLSEKGIDPFILIHDETDLWIADEIRKRSGKNLEIVKETDPIAIKGIIGICKGIISSRFHGLVSALSQGVPALATGWSHKYEMLFAEYGFPEGCLHVNASAEEIRDKIERITDQEQAARLRQKLTQAADVQRKRSEKMWEMTFDCIDS